MRPGRLLTLSAALLLLAFPALAAEVSIGVLALRGPEKAEQMWSATATYLERALPGNRFHIVPLDFDGVRLAVRQGSIDFVLTNSSYYVELESLYGVSAVATLKNRFNGGPGHSTFGGVLFARADRQDIRSLADLRKKRFAAVDPSSFGGWQVGWRELLHHGIDPDQDFRSLSFEHTHDAVVYAVRDGRVDAGTVRTDTLERMAEEGKIRLEDFLVLNRQQVEGFPLMLSTPLYPEWPLARLRQVPDPLAVGVAIALMQMPADDPAARAGLITGWTLPHNYQPVHDALRELRIGAYEHLRRLTLAEVLAAYGRWLLLAALLAVTGFVVLGYVSRMNRRLRVSQGELQNLNVTLEERVGSRTREVESLLGREHFLRNVVVMVADVNQILITSVSLEEMLKACCDRLVAGTDYRFAWVGLLRDGKLEVAAKSYGPAEFMRAMASAADRQSVRAAMAGNRTVVTDDPEVIGADLVSAGVHAAVVLPLRRDAFADPLGNLCVLTGREAGVDKEELEMLEQLAGDIGFAIHAFRQREETRRLQRERIGNYEETILSLVDMIEKRDTYTAGHTRRVAHYCELIAARMGHSVEEIEKLKRAATLHDIGKIAIPDAVLLKPGVLTPLEYELIKEHAEEGYRTLVRIDMYKELAEIMRAHHERENGSGYPRSLLRGQIPRLSQIMAVADSFDAMTTNRIYKPRKEVPVALAELRQMAGEFYDAEVVAAACEALRDEVPPPIADQLPKTPLERRRFAYFFDDQLTGAHNASYLELILASGLPAHLRHACLVQIHGFGSVNQAQGWVVGSRALAGFAAALMAQFPDALVFRVMGDDFIVLSGQPLDIRGERLKAESPLKDSAVEVTVRGLDVDGADKEYLRQLV